LKVKIINNAKIEFLSPDKIIANTNIIKNMNDIIPTYLNLLNLKKKKYKNIKPYVTRKLPAINSFPKKPENLSQYFGSISNEPFG
jgi:hypothetical protein